MKYRLLLAAAAVAVGCSAPTSVPAPSSPSTPAPLGAKLREDRMSPMGRLAHAQARRLAASLPGGPTLFAFDSAGNCTDGPDCEDEDNPFVEPDSPVIIPAGQAETSIAVDQSGQHVVIGFNDFSGFLLNPISVSGVAVSDDGGRTFTNVGPLPSPGTDVIAGTKFPQVFGDPTVKYLGGCTFVYGSIVMQKFNHNPADTNTVQTMGLHRSTDCGHTWQGPFEITAATNPSGTLRANGAPTDAADKEFLDVDPDTGRLGLSWTNFSGTGPQMRVTFSDDAATATPPTWSRGVVVSAARVDGQGSMPAFVAGSHDLYVAWARFPGGNNGNIGFARSHDDGVTFDAPINLTQPFFRMDQVLGNDRVGDFPAIAVDNSRGRHRGNIYVVYADNDGHDGADVVVQRSSDGGTTFDAPVVLNSRPGQDRAQWFPSVSVDGSSGRVYVIFFDQGVAKSGDLTQTSYVFSDDGGATWSRPRALTDRPFHAAWGNDTSQPNLGDYIQGATRDGDLFAAYAVTRPVGFADGEPTSTSLTVPDVEVKHVDAVKRLVDGATLQAGDPTVRDSGHDGNIDAGEIIDVAVPLTNFVTNPLNAVTLREVTVVPTTRTAHVIAIPGAGHIDKLAPGETANANVILFVGADFVPGTPIELELRVIQAIPIGFVTLRLTLDTGTPTATPIFAENFDGVAPGSLPAGWTAVHNAGANVVPWTTSASFCGGRSNGAFHVNAEDGPVRNGVAGDPTRFERLFSPVINIPADASFVTLEFDVCYDTEDDPAFNILAFDGFLLRIFDATPGRLPRSVLVDAFESRFTTGASQGYPKHFPRNGGGVYFEDMSAWAGDSGGVQHVKLRLPGMAGSTVQLRWEYTQDGGGICSDVRPGHSCGVLFDNVVMSSVKIGPRSAAAPVAQQ